MGDALQRLHTLPAGPASLTDAELVAVLLEVDDQAVGAIERHLTLLGGLGHLALASTEELLEVGFCAEHAERITVAVELVCRSLTPRARGFELCGPEQVFTLLAPRLALQDQERFVVICLDHRHRIKHMETVTIGTSGYVVIDPSVVYCRAVRLGAACLVVAHNHPSGDKSPSPQDIQITQRLAAAGEVLGIPLLDHVIVAREGFTSLAATGILCGITSTYR